MEIMRRSWARSFARGTFAGEAFPTSEGITLKPPTLAWLKVEVEMPYLDLLLPNPRNSCCASRKSRAWQNQKLGFKLVVDNGRCDAIQSSALTRQVIIAPFEKVNPFEILESEMPFGDRRGQNAKTALCIAARRSSASRKQVS